MGRGSSSGKVSDYYKRKGQKTHGEGARRRKLSRESAERRRGQAAGRRASNPAKG